MSQPEAAGPVVLAVDTSGPWCAVAVLRGGVAVGAVTRPMQKGQAEALMPLIHDLLIGSKVALTNLTGIGVGIGPGNFTGVRIAVSAARGLALGLRIPAVGVSRFQAEVGVGATAESAISLSAPREQAYVQRLDGLTPVGPPLSVAIAGPEALCLPDGVVLSGYAADRLSAHAKAYDPDDRVEDLAARIGRIASAWLASGATLPRPAPLYVRAADAAPSRDPAPVLLP